MKLSDEELMILSEVLEPYKFNTLKAKIDKELSRHDWKLLGSPGLYDDNYKCSKCGEIVSSSADGDDGRTEFRCTGEKNNG